MAMLIMAISPHFNYTKIALYDNYDLVWMENQRYTSKDLEIFPSIAEQEKFRSIKVMELLEARGESLSEVGAFAAIGGMLRPLESGVYAINTEMVSDLLSSRYGCSPMNLGAPMALRLAGAADAKYALVVDPPVIDEMPEPSRMTGLPGIRRRSVFHAINHKMVEAKEAKRIGKPISECSFIICNLDTTISIASHAGGRVIDVNDTESASGPMSPRQSGDLPPLQLVELCFSGKYSLEELRIRITGAGGFVGHLGTDCFEEIVNRVRSHDIKYQAVFEAFVYSLLKHIGAHAAVLNGRVDSIILTGMMAANKFFTSIIAEKVKWIAPVSLYPGRDDITALINGAMRVITGTETLKTYPGP